MSTPNKTAIGYIRVSTEDQEDEGVSLDVQIQQLTRFAEAMGYEMLDVLVDVKTAKNIEGRPGMSKLLKMARSGVMDTIIGFKLDRVFRNHIEAITIIPELQALGVGSIFMDLGGTPINTNSPAGMLMLQVMSALGEFERNRIGERVREALRYKRDHGQQYSAVPPFGWRHEDGSLIEDEKEQSTLYRICVLHRIEHRNLTFIADKLADDNYRTRAGKRIWQPGTIGKIIKNPLVTEKFDHWEQVYRDSEKQHAADSPLLHGKSSTGTDEGDAHVPVH